MVRRRLVLGSMRSGRDGRRSAKTGAETIGIRAGTTVTATAAGIGMIKIGTGTGTVIGVEAVYVHEIWLGRILEGTVTGTTTATLLARGEIGTEKGTGSVIVTSGILETPETGKGREKGTVTATVKEEIGIATEILGTEMAVVAKGTVTGTEIETATGKGKGIAAIVTAPPATMIGTVIGTAIGNGSAENAARSRVKAHSLEARRLRC